MGERSYQYHHEGPPPSYHTLHDQAPPRPSAPPPFSETDFGTGGANPQPPRENAPLLPNPPELNAETEVFSLEKFVFLWLGIGHKYSGLCLVVFLLIYAGGIVIIIIAALLLPHPYPNPDYYYCNPQQGYIFFLLSGVLFLLIGSYWPIVYCWKIRQGRNFTMLGCYSCVLSTLFVSCVAALGATVGHCFDGLSFSVSIAMGVVVFIFLCCSSVCCLCCSSNKIGRIC